MPLWQKAVLVVVVGWFLLLEPAQRRTAVVHALTVTAHQAQHLATVVDTWAKHWERETVSQP
jgi:hypothetical protein